MKGLPKQLRKFAVKVILVKLKGKPVDVINVQVYKPISDHSCEEVDDMYEIRKPS